MNEGKIPLCPRCQVYLSSTVHREQEIYACNQCQGQWIAMPTLRRLLGHQEGEEILKRARGEGLMCSPVDGAQKMQRVYALHAPKVALDHCVQADSVWFDGGELEAVYQARAAHREQQRQALAQGWEDGEEGPQASAAWLWDRDYGPSFWRNLFKLITVPFRPPWLLWIIALVVLVELSSLFPYVGVFLAPMMVLFVLLQTLITAARGRMGFFDLDAYEDPMTSLIIPLLRFVLGALVVFAPWLILSQLMEPPGWLQQALYWGGWAWSVASLPPMLILLALTTRFLEVVDPRRALRLLRVAPLEFLVASLLFHGTLTLGGVVMWYAVKAFSWVNPSLIEGLQLLAAMACLVIGFQGLGVFVYSHWDELTDEV